LEAVEFFIRSSLLSVGTETLSRIFEIVLSRNRGITPVCECGRTMENKGRKPKTVITIFGEVTYKRSFYICPWCGKTRFPADEKLGLSGESYSPGVKRIMAYSGSKEPFEQAADDLKLYTGLCLNSKQLERTTKRVGAQVASWMESQGTQSVLRKSCHLPQLEAQEPVNILYVSFDGTGVPIRPQELKGVKGKYKDGKARTKEAKLGCVFTQTSTDEKGRPQRDEASTTYVGGIEKSVDFGYRIYAEAVRRGADTAKEIVVLTDGAKYNKSIVDKHFPDATHIIDLYHAREKLYDIKKILGDGKIKVEVIEEWLDLLNKGDIERLVGTIMSLLPRSGRRKEESKNILKYFEKNAEKMRYEKFHKLGYFVGSGVVEAGCKSLIGKRLKNSGMFWSIEGANAVIALRCCILSGRYEQFLEDIVA